MSAEESKAVVRRLVEAVNQGDLAALDALFAPDYVHHSGREHIMDREGFKQGFAAVRAAIPDYRAELRHLVAEGAMVASYWVVRGTHLGEFAGVAATGRPVTVVGTVFHRIVDGRVAEDWEVFDLADWRQQVGATAS